MKLNLLIATALVLSATMAKAELQAMSDAEMRSAGISQTEEQWNLSVSMSEQNQIVINELTQTVIDNYNSLSNENQERFLRLAGILENQMQNIQIAQLPMQLLNLHLINQYQKDQTSKYQLFQEMISSLSNSNASRISRINSSLEKAGNAVMNAIQNIGSNGVITADRLSCPTGLNSCVVEKGLTLDKKGLGILSSMQIIGLDWSGINITIQFKK